VNLTPYREPQWFSKWRPETAQNSVPLKGPVGLLPENTEQNQNRISLMVPRGGVPWASKINAVRWQTAARGGLDPQRFSGAVANHQPMPSIFPSGHRAKANGRLAEAVQCCAEGVQNYLDAGGAGFAD
jgi:hypothetical protein